MEAVEIFTILERAKMKRLANICKQGNTDHWNDVLCEERAYEALTEVTSDIINTLGPDIIPLYNAVTELVMKEEGRQVTLSWRKESSKLPEDVRQALDDLVKEGVLDVEFV